jgi:hypothetical protein
MRLPCAGRVMKGFAFAGAGTLVLLREGKASPFFIWEELKRHDSNGNDDKYGTYVSVRF